MKYCAYLFIVLFTLCSCGDEYLRKRVNTLEKEVDTLRNEIAIYKGMERDVRSRDLDDLVFISLQILNITIIILIVQGLRLEVVRLNL